ncbi:GntR family transcriptional regulator [Corynebacterium breve]|uniref:GntR family transcriptional regulator n=1 Tax=Corynebacterium breve TaxID=3049799 RepID=A0ABY8VFV5_9CORY|nr:GntR family transcriptional regulator [Corynebacterium breve]WIM67523.1 GntR family transcriptional regulator [Corynebacterium breve]
MDREAETAATASRLSTSTRTITEGPEPKHAQLRAILEELCDTTLKPGELLPGERVLEEQFSVSRITVRRAIGDLVAAGKLRRVRGKGTFVAPNPLVSRLHLASFSDEMRAQKVDATSKILLSARDTAPDDVVNFFRSQSTAQHIHLRRLRLGDGEPYSIDDAWYNGHFTPDLLENDVYNSVYTLLEKNYGLPVTEADQTVTAVAASDSQAALLDVSPGSPLLHIVRFARSGDKPVELCASVYRTDRYRLTTRVTRELD